jgi:hypothetical protein
MSYAKLVKPAPFIENGKPKGDPVYSTQAIILNDDMASFHDWDADKGEFHDVELARVCASLAKAEWPEMSVKEAVAHGGLNWPIQNGDALAESLGEKGKHYAGARVIRMKANQEYPPKLYFKEGSGRKQIARGTSNGEAQATQYFYSGAYAFAEITVQAGTAGQNKYVTCYVNAVHFVKHGDRLGGASLMDRFDGIHGGESNYDPTGGGADLDDEIPY